MLLPTFQCVHLPGTSLGAGDTVMGQKTHTNPAPMDLLVSAHTPKQANQYIILTSAIGEKLFEENS